MLPFEIRRAVGCPSGDAALYSRYGLRGGFRQLAPPEGDHDPHTAQNEGTAVTQPQLRASATARAPLTRPLRVSRLLIRSEAAQVELGNRRRHRRRGLPSLLNPASESQAAARLGHFDKKGDSARFGKKIKEVTVPEFELKNSREMNMLGHHAARTLDHHNLFLMGEADPDFNAAVRVRARVLTRSGY